MIRIRTPVDLNRDALVQIAYDGARLTIDDELLREVEAGRRVFLRLIESGASCYGVNTGLGKLAGVSLDSEAGDHLPRNILRARAAAFGPAFEPEVVRAMMVIKLVNFLSARDGVRAETCEYLAARLNDDFVPWVPKHGHGMAADAIANSHAFQTFIGEGFVLDRDGNKCSAADMLAERGIEPLRPVDKEGIAFVSGLTISVAYALHAQRRLLWTDSLAHAIAAVSIEGMAANKESVSELINTTAVEPGVARSISVLKKYLRESGVEPVSFQAAVSYRAIPQVLGAYSDSLVLLDRLIDRSLNSFSGNPMLVMEGTPEPRLLSVGLFHDQHLVNQIDQVALSLAHVGILSQRRLHRLLDADMTGLNPQLAARPGVDAGLVVTQKASLGLESRLKLLAQPVSLTTGETSGGQEDYMTMAVPAVSRLFEMAEVVDAMLAFELLAAVTALNARQGVPGRGVLKVCEYTQDIVANPPRDSAPGPVIEELLRMFNSTGFRQVLRAIEQNT